MNLDEAIRDALAAEPLPTASVADRAGIRTAVVALYRAACERLGVPPRQH